MRQAAGQHEAPGPTAPAPGAGRRAGGSQAWQGARKKQAASHPLDSGPSWVKWGEWSPASSLGMYTCLQEGSKGQTLKEGP